MKKLLIIGLIALGVGVMGGVLSAYSTQLYNTPLDEIYKPKVEQPKYPTETSEQ